MRMRPCLGVYGRPLVANMAIYQVANLAVSESQYMPRK